MFGALFAQGALAYVLVGFGFAAVAAGLLSVALARSHASPAVGIVALALTLGCSTTALIGTIAGRTRIERVAAEAEPSQRQKVREEGYRVTREIAQAGFGFTLPAFILGAAGTTLALLKRRRKQPDEQGLGVPLGAIVLGSVAAFSVIATGTPLLMGVPGKELAADDPARKFLLAEEQLAEGRVGEACVALDEAYKAEAKPSKVNVRSVEALVSECFEQKLGQADAAPSLEERDRELEWLAGSRLPLNETQRARLEDERAKSKKYREEQR
ncbi:MAG: hypothetical protein JNL21_10295 [Myxococcales bacterium]|nr:hypothetical protein [Myxococcales bacterium]